EVRRDRDRQPGIVVVRPLRYCRLPRHHHRLERRLHRRPRVRHGDGTRHARGAEPVRARRAAAHHEHDVHELDDVDLAYDEHEHEQPLHHVEQHLHVDLTHDQHEHVDEYDLDRCPHDQLDVHELVDQLDVVVVQLEHEQLLHHVEQQLHVDLTHDQHEHVVE